MPVFVSLIRGINVGGNKLIKMDALKALHEGLGFEDVKTLLASGNVVFTARDKDRKKLPGAIEAAIEKEIGFRPTVMVRSATELKAIAERNPFAKMAKTNPGHLVWMALAGKPHSDAQARLARAYSGPEEIEIVGEDAYITYPNGIGRSKLTNALLEKHLGVAGTARNWNTLTKLLVVADAIDPRA
jgi:uncharacterized protein (DUF1697 family)